MTVEPDAARENKLKPKPLTKRTVETQTIYRRRPEVEAQIGEVLNSSDSEIVERLSAVDGDARFLKTETLVYLLRECLLAGNDQLFNQAYEVVGKRILRLLIGRKRKFREAMDFDDFLQDVQLIMLKKVFDFESNAGDYAQVSFGNFIVTLAVGEMKKYFGKLKQTAEFVSIDEDATDDKPKFELAAPDLSTEKQMILRAAIERLPAEIREVAFLHYVDGWQIDSKNPFEPTLSRKYNKSEKTIRNWLRKAAELLQDWKGEIR